MDEAACRRVERLEQPILDRHLGARQRVQQRRLPGVRVAGEGDGRNFGAPPLASARFTLPFEILEALLEQRDPPPRQSPVRLQLRLARASRSDAAAESLEVLPHAAHARQVVFELRQLDLQLPFRGDCVLGKDVEDQLRPVDDPNAELVLEEALLRRLELVVDEQALGRRGAEALLQLVQLAATDVRHPRRPRTALDDLSDRLDACRACKLAYFGELVVGVHPLCEHREHEAALDLTARQTWNHRPIMPAADATTPVAARALDLVDIPSVSGSEAAVTEYVRRAVRLPAVFDDGESLVYAVRGGRPLVLLAGHTDTVPAQDNLPGSIDGGAVVGLGASDMKGGLAVMIELANWAAVADLAYDLAVLFFPREELGPSVNPLPGVFARVPLIDEASLVVVLEPTDNTLQLGCLGNLNARVVFEGRAAHSARPWHGVNAVGVAFEGLRSVLTLEPRDVQIEGLVFREVLSVTEIHGGIASNVIPASVEVTLNFRYAPDRTPEDAVARVAELVGRDVEILANSPPAHVPSLDSPAVAGLRAAGPFRVEPKQAWTNVADFAARGLDAVNLGPGATRYAHTADERVEIAELERTLEALKRFLSGEPVPLSE